MALQTKYLASSKVVVFPTANRSSTGLTTDPESIYTSETNVTKATIAGLGFSNFIKEDGDNLTLFISGYRFDVSKSDILTLFNNTDSAIYAYITITPRSGSKWRQLSVADNASQIMLDDDVNNHFLGLGFTTTDPSSDSIKTFVKVLDNREVPTSYKMTVSSTIVSNDANNGTDTGTPISERFTTAELKAGSAEAPTVINSSGVSVQGDVIMTNNGKFRHTKDGTSYQISLPDANGKLMSTLKLDDNEYSIARDYAYASNYKMSDLMFSPTQDIPLVKPFFLYLSDVESDCGYICKMIHVSGSGDSEKRKIIFMDLSTSKVYSLTDKKINLTNITLADVLKDKLDCTLVNTDTSAILNSTNFITSGAVYNEVLSLNNRINTLNSTVDTLKIDDLGNKDSFDSLLSSAKDYFDEHSNKECCGTYSSNRYYLRRIVDSSNSPKIYFEGIRTGVATGIQTGQSSYSWSKSYLSTESYVDSAKTECLNSISSTNSTVSSLSNKVDKLCSREVTTDWKIWGVEITKPGLYNVIIEASHWKPSLEGDTVDYFVSPVYIPSLSIFNEAENGRKIFGSAVNIVGTHASDLICAVYGKLNKTSSETGICISLAEAVGDMNQVNFNNNTSTEYLKFKVVLVHELI